MRASRAERLHGSRAADERDELSAAAHSTAGEQRRRNVEAERLRGREVCSNKHRLSSVINCGREIRLRSTSQFDREAKPAPITTLQAAAVAAFSSTFSTITGVS